MRVSERATIALVIATLMVVCFLVFDPMDLGISDCLENFDTSISAVGTVMVSIPNFFLGYSKAQASKPFFSNKRTKPTPAGKNKVTKLQVFKGREAKLNKAIFYVLSHGESPLAIWNILKQITVRKGFKRTKYAVVNSRVKALETEGYLRMVGVREKKSGGETNLYEITEHAELAMVLSSESMDTIVNELDCQAALTIFSLIISRERRKI